MRNRLVLSYCGLRDSYSKIVLVSTCRYGSCGQYERNVTTAPLVPESTEQSLLLSYVRSIRRVERLLTPKRYRSTSDANRAVPLLKRHCAVGPFTGSDTFGLSSIVEDTGSSARTTEGRWHVHTLAGLKMSRGETGLSSTILKIRALCDIDSLFKECAQRLPSMQWMCFAWPV